MAENTDVIVAISGAFDSAFPRYEILWDLAYKFSLALPSADVYDDKRIAGLFVHAAENHQSAVFKCRRGEALDEALRATSSLGLSYSVEGMRLGPRGENFDVTVTIGGSITDENAMWALAYKFGSAEPSTRLRQNGSDIASILLHASAHNALAMFKCGRGEHLENALQSAMELGLSFSVLGVSKHGNMEIEVYSPDIPSGRTVWDCDVRGVPVVEAPTLARWQQEGRVPEMLVAMQAAMRTPASAFKVGIDAVAVLSRLYT